MCLSFVRNQRYPLVKWCALRIDAKGGNLVAFRTLMKDFMAYENGQPQLLTTLQPKGQKLYQQQESTYLCVGRVHAVIEGFN